MKNKLHDKSTFNLLVELNKESEKRLKELNDKAQSDNIEKMKRAIELNHELEGLVSSEFSNKIYNLYIEGHFTCEEAIQVIKSTIPMRKFATFVNIKVEYDILTDDDGNEEDEVTILISFDCHEGVTFHPNEDGELVFDRPDMGFNTYAEGITMKEAILDLEETLLQWSKLFKRITPSI
jgi:hypothetical protein